MRYPETLSIMSEKGLKLILNIKNSRLIRKDWLQLDSSILMV